MRAKQKQALKEGEERLLQATLVVSDFFLNLCLIQISAINYVGWDAL